MDTDFLEQINWANLRTQTQLDLPCAICGCLGKTEMHHIKHVRKRKYSLIPLTASFVLEKLMHIRNRRQIPLFFFLY
jgi:hypothetical protein